MKISREKGRGGQISGLIIRRKVFRQLQKRLKKSEKRSEKLIKMA